MYPNVSAAELQKRKRERRLGILIAIGFIVSVVVQASLTERRQTYGFLQSLLYFGLIHLNVILIMLLAFLVFRNLIKAYLMRRSGKLGSSLRWRMVASLMAFSLLPSILLFTGSSYIIRQGFDKWLGNQVGQALEDARALTEVHYNSIESNLTFYSSQVLDHIKTLKRVPDPADVEQIRNKYPIDAIEVYRDLVSPPVRYLKPELQDWSVPRASTETLQSAFQGTLISLTRQFGDGDLVQHFTLVKIPVSPAETKPVVLVLSNSVPLGLKSQISDLQRALTAYSSTRQIKDELKTRYTLVLLTLFLLTMFVVSWFGLYIAKAVTEPVADLLRGTEAFREGRWDYRIPTVVPSADKQVQLSGISGAGADLEVLKAAFNLMAEEVGRRGRQLEEANGQLISLVRELEDRERYLEILLSSIRRGVVVIDTGGFIRRINDEALAFAAESLGSLDPASMLGRHWREVFANFGVEDEAQEWLNEASERRGQPVDRIFEAGAGEGRSTSQRSVRATGIQLRDERGNAFGWMIILEDVSDAARLERLAAWQEVARRVAHEIKNPLTPIQISADRLYKRFSQQMEENPIDGPVFKESVKQIQKQVRVIRNLVREFAEFSKLPEPKMASVNVRELIEEVLKDYRFNHPHCKFVFDSQVEASRSLFVRGDSSYLRRLMVNLADNAVHSLEAAKSKDAQLNVSMSVAAASPDFVMVVFEDNGPGIAPSMREKIFDPYITSKASGMGLGLAIVRRIAMEHSGRIRCEEASGGRFVLELPLLSVESKET